jgi:hypothetical protein
MKRKIVSVFVLGTSLVGFLALRHLARNVSILSQAEMATLLGGDTGGGLPKCTLDCNNSNCLTTNLCASSYPNCTGDCSAACNGGGTWVACQPGTSMISNPNSCFTSNCGVACDPSSSTLKCASVIGPKCICSGTCSLPNVTVNCTRQQCVSWSCGP